MAFHLNPFSSSLQSLFKKYPHKYQVDMTFSDNRVKITHIIIQVLTILKIPILSI